MDFSLYVPEVTSSSTVPILLRSGALYVNEIDLAVLIKISNLIHLATEKGNAFANMKSAYATSILRADSALGTLVGSVVCVVIGIDLLGPLVANPATFLFLMGTVEVKKFLLLYADADADVDAAMGTSSAAGMDETPL